LLYVIIVAISKTIKEENKRLRFKLAQDYEIVDLKGRFKQLHLSNEFD
jgi:hypothetical protein